jgi:hypothetical protein
MGHPNMELDHMPWWPPCKGEYFTQKKNYVHTFIHNSNKDFFFTQMAKGINEAIIAKWIVTKYLKGDVVLTSYEVAWKTIPWK